jgi:hypothetical protein
LSDISTSTIEERCSVATQHAVSNKAAQLHPAPSSSREALPDIAIQAPEEGTKRSKKRRKQCHQETAIATDDNGDISKQAGSSGMVRTVVASGINKHQVQPPTDHFKRLLEETCLNYAYPVKHKLRDCSMMKSFITSGVPPLKHGSR